MNKETQRKADQEPKPLTIPVAFLLDNQGRIFLLSEEDPKKYKYNRNDLFTLIGWGGEESASDLPSLAQKIGFKIVVDKKIGTIKGDADYQFAVGRPVEFDLYTCLVVEGSFKPEIIDPKNPDSHYNYFSNYKGDWFEISLLNGQPLHPIVREGLKILQDNG